tara:strand:+ start:1081 stop:1539 length:459 start_codon:yes stop_codon:yes gene_type:complete
MLRIEDYLWVAEDGMKMQGYNGSQCWDTSFAARAICEAGLASSFSSTVLDMWSFLEKTQILSTNTSKASLAYNYETLEMRQKYYRHVSQGGWPFSTLKNVEKSCGEFNFLIVACIVLNSCSYRVTIIFLTVHSIVLLFIFESITVKQIHKQV